MTAASAFEDATAAAAASGSASGQSAGAAEFLVASVSNLRDLGGLATASGQRIAPGRVWRSSHFGDIASDDAATLHALGFRTVVDLRGVAERERAPSRLAADALRYVHLPIEPRAMGAVRERREAGTLDDAALVEIMFEVYRRFARLHSPVFTSFLQLMADDSTALPLVFHCTAGKDRTGWAAALLLLALGVPREAVVADSLRSNGRWRAQDASSDWAVLATVRPGYLQCGFDEIDRGWGSFDAYLEGPLGIDAAARERLRARLLVDA